MRPIWRRNRKAEDPAATGPTVQPDPPADREHLGNWLVRLGRSAPGLERTAEALKEIFETTPPERLLGLDAAARGWTRWDENHWRQLEPKDVALLTDDRPGSAAFLAAFSMHPSGHVREAATRRLAESRDPGQFRWLLVRCSDWVDDVRQQAERAVSHHLASSSGSEAFQAEVMYLLLLPLIVSEKLMRSTAQAELLEFVQREAQRSLLAEASNSSNQARRRAACRMLAARAPTLPLLEAQLRWGDVVAASEVMEALFGDSGSCLHAAEIVLACRHPRLRAAGLWHMIEHHPPAVRSINRSLLDSSAGVRWMAQRAAAEQGIDLAPWYRSMLDTRPLGALLGLGDLGSSEELDVADPYLGSERSDLRAAATRIVARRAPLERLDLLLDVALVESRRVAQEAIAGIRSLGIGEPMAERVWELAMSTTATPRGRRRLIRCVLARASRWTCLVMSLRAVAQDDEEMVQIGSDLLARTMDSWNSSATGPSAGQLEEISGLLAHLQRLRHGADGRLEQVEAMLKTWK